MSPTNEPVVSEGSPRPETGALVRLTAGGRPSETPHPRLELKSRWNDKCGESISAIANDSSRRGGWLIVGIGDKDGKPLHNEQWATKTKETIGNQINSFLSPLHAVKKISIKPFGDKYYIFLEVTNTGDIAEWKGEAYKLSGASCARMSSSERIQRSLNFPGEDFSRRPWNGKINDALVMDFAQKVAKADPDDLFKDLSKLSSSEVLKILRLDGKATSGILFGDFPIRVAYYDDNDDVIDNIEKQGLYNILTDDFISQIQTWTRQKGTIVRGNTTSAEEEAPYPPKLLREIFANATAHALYQRNKGEIIVDIHPDHIKVRNNALLESKPFSEQWFAKKTFVKNKLLMTTLRATRITDELDTGKLRVFRLAMESGKKEPIVEFDDLKHYGKWTITVYNNQQYPHLAQILEKFYDVFPSRNHARIAMALVLWRDKKWSFIEKSLDEYYKNIAFEVLGHRLSPVSLVEDDLLAKRWIDVALTGRTTKAFSPQEEEKIKKALKAFASESNRQGAITTKEAKSLIGLGDTPSEATQLSSIFRKWEKEKTMTRLQRGKWRFSLQDKDRSSQKRPYTILIPPVDIDFSGFLKDITDNGKPKK